MSHPYSAGLMWFRRDLRAHDNAGLYHALKACRQVHCAFVFDKDILDTLPRRDRRVEFIRESLLDLDEQLRALAGSADAGLLVVHAVAEKEIPALATALNVQAVFANHDYEPQAVARDRAVAFALAATGIAFHAYKDQVIFEKAEVLTQGGTPYSVFTPYKRAWLAKVDDFYLRPYAVKAYAASLAARPLEMRAGVPSLQELSFDSTDLAELQVPTGTQGGQELFNAFLHRIDRYDESRDFPAIRGPSYLSVHLRFGTVSIRALVGEAQRRADAGGKGAATWLSELIWRDFYFQILANFPHVADERGNGRSFKRDYERIEWETSADAQLLFAAWCEGRTGYPLVDAAMAQLLRSGYMHNRLRMVTASFLTKDLGIDWRRGERYFAEKLIDYDLAANNGGWQWAASTGCDAQPYFRIFNPVSQSLKFDPEGAFIRRYLPQLAGLQGKALHAPWTATPIELELAGVQWDKDYPKPIVDHDQARLRTLQRYAAVKTGK